MMIFRRATPEDIPDILQVMSEAKAAIGTLGIDQWKNVTDFTPLVTRDIESGHGYIYSENGHAVSYTALIPDREPVYDDIDGAWHTNDNYLTIHRVAVNDNYRHFGLAVSIMDHAKDYARSLRVSGIRIDTHRGNTVMRRFLTKNGFRECGFVRYNIINGFDPIRVAYDYMMNKTED